MEVIDDSAFDWHAYDVADEVGKIIEMADVADDVINSLHGDGVESGSLFPWNRMNDNHMRVREGEVSIYAGINGHWKSMATSQVGLHLMRFDEPIAMCSFEMKPSSTMARMARQATGTDDPSIQYLRKFFEWTRGRGLIYNHLGGCDPRKLLAVCRYLAAERGTKHVFIDSLMKVVPDVDDYSAQKLFVGDLIKVAQSTGMHIHLVAHARKGEKETDMIDKFSIKGASEIADQADNLYLCQRNKKKEKAKADSNFDDTEKPDFWLTVAKNRHGEFEGTIGLYWNPKSLCLVETPHGSWPTIYYGGDDNEG